MNSNILAKIQAELKVPKSQFNKFGNYKYRKAEDILEAVKPLLSKEGYYIILTDNIIEVGGRIYVQATATVSNGSEQFVSTGFAREEESKKGMDGSQVTGASSSYARKYALNGLFAIDDTRDSDDTNTHGKETAMTQEEFTDHVFFNYSEDKQDKLLRLVESSSYDHDQRRAIVSNINDKSTMTEAKYNKILTNLLANQLGIDGVVNPSATDIRKHVKKIANAKSGATE